MLGLTLSRATPRLYRLRPFDFSGRRLPPGRADRFQASVRNGRSCAGLPYRLWQLRHGLRAFPGGPVDPDFAQLRPARSRVGNMLRTKSVVGIALGRSGRPWRKDVMVCFSQCPLSALMLTEAIPPRVGRAKRTSASTRAPTTSYCLAVPSCPNRTPNLGLHGSSGRSSTLISATALASLWPAKAGERSIGLLWERPDIRDRTDGPGSKRQRFLPRGS
jgi:hypothetical protein